MKRRLALLSALALTPSGATADVFSTAQVLEVADRAYEYALAHPYTKTDRDWIRATFYSGVLELYHATGNPKYREQAARWAEEHRWQVGTESSGMNKLFCAMTWAELYLLEPEPRKIAPTIEWLATDAPNSPGGRQRIWFGHGPSPSNRPMYADSLYGAPVFAQLYKATGERKYLDTMHHVFWTVTDAIFDPAEDLYYRDAAYIGQKSPGGAKVLWSRGNGWVFAALPRLLKHLPKDDPSYARYVDLYRRMAKALADRQFDDGLWRANLADPWHYRMPESSGTAFFTAGFAWGVREGVLDRETYLPVVIKGWKALAGAVHPDGRLGWVQPVDAQPRPSLPDTTQEYAVGLLLSAAGQVYRLAQDGALTPEAVTAALPRETALLPPQALNVRALSEGGHPLHRQIEAFRNNQRGRTVRPTGLTKADYLDVIAGQARAMRGYQNDTGRIIDPVEKKEMYYSTPCYAHAVASLVAAGHPAGKELAGSGMKALDAALEDMAGAHPAGDHGDFYTWPAVWACELFEPLAGAERAGRWKERLKAVDPAGLYRAYRPPLRDHRAFYDEYHNRAVPDSGSYANWGVVNLAGEFARRGYAATNVMDYVDFNLTLQLPRFTPYGMYCETGSPPAYDLFPRHYLAGMLRRGYRGFVHSTYRDLLWRGAWSSLLIQSPAGELPTGYRSAHHIWNEAQEAVVFELYAAAYAEAGRADEAGAFKRAARLALRSVKDWIRPDGSGYIVKNRHPLEAMHGYETYSAHTCYNLLACSMLAQAWAYADDAVPEKPAPADVGGFVVPIVDRFHKIIANAGGTYVEYETKGDHKYNPTGLIRIHVKGGHPQLGPSDGCAPLFSGAGVHVATGPAWQEPGGAWRSLAELSPSAPRVEILDQDPARARFRVTFAGLSGTNDPTPIRLTETILVEPAGVTVTDELAGVGDRMRVTWPMLVSDGGAETEVKMAGNSASVRLRGRGVRFTVLEPAGATLTRSGRPVAHRNGTVEVATAEFSGARAVYRIDTPAVRGSPAP